MKELPLRAGTPIRPLPTFDADVGRLIRGIEKHLGIGGEPEHRAAVAPKKEAEDPKETPDAGTVFRDTLKDGSQGPDMVVIPAGKFLMGSPEYEVEREDDEGPQHEVVFERPFAIGKYAVTFEEYDRFVEAMQFKSPKDRGWGRGNLPVINVSRHNAEAYCGWLSEQTGKNYRLPSESEWEYAARAGTMGPFSFEGPISPVKVNYDAKFRYEGSVKSHYRKRTVPVGTLPANPWSLHEVHGNVNEWVADCWHESYEGAPADGRAWLQEDGGNCYDGVLRGGSWNFLPGTVRSARRLKYGPELGYGFIGFRLAHDL